MYLEKSKNQKKPHGPRESREALRFLVLGRSGDYCVFRIKMPCPALQ